MAMYKIYYTRTIQGEVDIEASTEREAEGIFESRDDKRGIEYEEPVEVYSVEEIG